MKYLLMAAMTAAIITAPAFAADVGVSISVGQPGFYGHIDIGDFPQPRVIYGEPIMVERGPIERPPVYLHVLPGHAKHWSKHCLEYNACGERVFFVEDSWYNREYVPRYQERYREHRDERRDNHRDERHDDDRDHDHGNGHGHGHDD